MDRVDNLAEILRREVADYANANSWKGTLLSFEDQQQQAYSVVFTPNEDHPNYGRQPNILVMARLLEDKILIEVDKTDRPLYEELMRHGIPRKQIILAYAGETLPPTE
jgi:hypothetical protein